MKLFQLIFAIGCIVIGVFGAPGNVSYFRINNWSDWGETLSFTLIIYFSIQNIIEGNNNYGNHQSNSDIGISLAISRRGRGWLKFIICDINMWFSENV